jgi:hypothetical protein
VGVILDRPVAAGEQLLADFGEHFFNEEQRRRQREARRQAER